MFLPCLYDNGDPDAIANYFRSVFADDIDLKNGFMDYEDEIFKSRSAQDIKQEIDKLNVKFIENFRQELGLFSNSQYDFQRSNDYKSFISDARNGGLLITFGKRTFAAVGKAIYEIGFSVFDPGKMRERDIGSPLENHIENIVRIKENIFLGLQQSCIVYLLAQLWQVDIFA